MAMAAGEPERAIAAAPRPVVRREPRGAPRLRDPSVRRAHVALPAERAPASHAAGGAESVASGEGVAGPPSHPPWRRSEGPASRPQGFIALVNSSGPNVLSTSSRRSQPRRAMSTPQRAFRSPLVVCASTETTNRIPRARASRIQRGSMSSRWGSPFTSIAALDSATACRADPPTVPPRRTPGHRRPERARSAARSVPWLLRRSVDRFVQRFARPAEK